MDAPIEEKSDTYECLKGRFKNDGDNYDYIGVKNKNLILSLNIKSKLNTYMFPSCQLNSDMRLLFKKKDPNK